MPIGPFAGLLPPTTIIPFPLDAMLMLFRWTRGKIRLATTLSCVEGFLEWPIVLIGWTEHFSILMKTFNDVMAMNDAWNAYGFWRCI